MRHDEEKIRQDVMHWDSKAVDEIIRMADAERSRPSPKRYFVSLKEPLEETGLR
jgi:hypothetical protein